MNIKKSVLFMSEKEHRISLKRTISTAQLPPLFDLTVKNMNDTGFFYTLLKESLKHLALSAEKQIRYIESIGLSDTADELALEFDDVFGLLGVFASEGYISQDFAQKIKDIDVKLAAISGKENFWDFDALLHNPVWQEVRLLAQNALESIGETWD